MITFSGCASLMPVQVEKNIDYLKYKYALINTAGSVVSASGYVNSYNYGYGYGISSGVVSTTNINPSDFIAGYLMKKNIIIVNQIKNPAQTLVIQYGQSGTRQIAGGLLGYTMEVTIQLIDASTHKLVSKCTAEGMGSSEVEDIRQAVTRCLDAL